MSDMDNLADAITGAFVDEHDDENLTVVVDRLARAIRDLGNGDAATTMGGMEALGKAMIESAETIASAIGRLADAIERSQP